MAVSVDWANRIIMIPKGDPTVMTLIQSTPNLVYELDTVILKAVLKDLEDNIDGIAYPRILNHNASVTVGGVQLAPVIEIINDYTITFDDTASDPYAVNLNKSNNNIADRTNVNTVSVRPNNSAGLIQTREIEYASFQNGVWLNQASADSGQVFPYGTRLKPVNNLTDALTIMAIRGFRRLYVIGNATFTASDVINDIEVYGESTTQTVMTFELGCQTQRTEFFDAELTGDLYGALRIVDCQLVDAYGIGGPTAETSIITSNFESGTIGITPGAVGVDKPIYIIDCYAGTPDKDQYTVDIDLGGVVGPNVIFRGWKGPVTLLNCSDPDRLVSFDITTGEVTLDASISDGQYRFNGVGGVIKNNTGGTVDVSRLMNVENIAKMIVEADGNITLQQAISMILADAAGEYEEVGDTSILKSGAGNERVRGNVDVDGNRSNIQYTPSVVP